MFTLETHLVKVWTASHLLQLWKVVKSRSVEERWTRWKEYRGTFQVPKPPRNTASSQWPHIFSLWGLLSTHAYSLGQHLEPICSGTVIRVIQGSCKNIQHPVLPGWFEEIYMILGMLDSCSALILSTALQIWGPAVYVNEKQLFLGFSLLHFGDS